MAISVGMRLGPYEILQRIGAGGMGEVYKGRDTRLNRSIAVKILPPHLSEDADLKRRFEREAQTIAGLNHPNICVLHDIGQQDGTDYLVMEFLEGQTLAARLAKGPLPLDEALRYAIQIADALDKTHGQGVTHRDLKPGNVMLVKSGAKLLDFGLAKSRTAKDVSSASAPTVEADLTAHGALLGTVQYMAPEQIEGEEADARTDIFAFGAILYEMITGKKAFEGKSQASLMAAILQHDVIPMSSLQPKAPAALQRITEICLAKDPRNRWQTAHDVMLQLQWIIEGGSHPSMPAPLLQPRKRGQRLVWSLLAVTAAALAAVSVLYFSKSSAEFIPARFSISPTGGAVFGPGQRSPYPAISPDGRRIVFPANEPNGPTKLWVRAIDSLDAQPLPGTEGTVLGPFWSPDGRQIGFFGGTGTTKLKRVEFSGGPVQELCCNSMPVSGDGAWNKDGVILFNTPNGIYRVSASGGDPVQVTTLDASLKENSHREPHFLPDGRHFTYLSQTTQTAGFTVYVASLESADRKKLMTVDARALYTPPGYLLFVRDGSLMGQPFDAKSLSLKGEPFLIAEKVRFTKANGRSPFSVSENGTLLYRLGTAIEGSRLAWIDRNGVRSDTIYQTGYSVSAGLPRLSFDDKRIVAERVTPTTATDLWIIDLVRGTNSRFTSGIADEISPVWSPDASRVVFASNKEGHYDLYEKSVSGVGDEKLLWKSDHDKAPSSWSPDGHFVLVQTQADIWTLPVNGSENAKPEVFLKTPFSEGQGQFSPDGRWVAYTSNESGGMQVYVRPFPAGPSSQQWQVSLNGGQLPRWRGDGKELFFLDARRNLMAAAIKPGESFDFDRPNTVFEVTGTLADTPGYAPTRDGQRFLFPGTPPDDVSIPLTIVLNWTAGQKK